MPGQPAPTPAPYSARSPSRLLPAFLIRYGSELTSHEVPTAARRPRPSSSAVALYSAALPRWCQCLHVAPAGEAGY